MWMTREEIAATLGIVPNSVRGKVQKGQIERKIEGGKNFYRIISAEPKRKSNDEDIQVIPSPVPVPEPKPAPERQPAPVVVEVKPPEVQQPKLPVPEKKTPAERGPFNPKQVLLDMLASIKVDRSIDAIERGDEIDLATGEISRELDARISMRQHRQLKEIEDALERIKYGEYGSCEECGEHIPEQRLRLFPAARLCVRCQEEMDQYEKMKDSQGMRSGIWREDATESYAKSFED